MSYACRHRGVVSLFSDPAVMTSTSEQRPIYGKIKEMPPLRRQSIAMACLPAGASVGARAARKRNTSKINARFGTGYVVTVLGTIAPLKTRSVS